MRGVTQIMRVSFYALYRAYYAPKFMAADVLLKSMDGDLTVGEAAGALCMTEESVRRVMADAGVTRLNKRGFLTVMRGGDSALCRMYRRELKCGMRASYSPEQIAYIYGLHKKTVRSAANKIGLDKIPARDIPELLEMIEVYIMCPK